MDNIFKGLFSKAKRYLDDRKRLKKLLSKASDKSMSLKDENKRKAFKDDINSSIMLLKDWSNKEYTAIPKKSILSIIAALIYFVIPTDLIPDFILGTGFLDDAAVLSFLFASIKGDIEDYKLYKLNMNNQKTYLEKAFVGFESASKLCSQNELYLLKTLLYYFSKYEYTKESLNDFLNKRAKDYYIRNFFAMKRKESNIHLPLFILSYSIFNTKDKNIFKNDINDIVEILMKNEDKVKTQDLLFIFHSIVNKINDKESNKDKIFFDHDFDNISFDKDYNLELGSGRFFKIDEKEMFGNQNHDLMTILKQICYIIYNSKSYLEIQETLKEYENLHMDVKIIVLFLGGIYYDNKIEIKNSNISELLNLKL